MKTLGNTKRLIAQYQRPAFDRLMQIVETARTMQKYDLPISPRTNTLIVGPTGTGKSHLVRAVAAECGAKFPCGVKFLSISALEWIPLGAAGRGSEITWMQIATFLHAVGAQSKSLARTEESFGIIFLDEIDKLSAAENAWQNYIRTEAFRLLDRQLPSGLKDEFDANMDEAEKIKLQHTLTHRTVIISAGAFQSHWDETERPSLGFHQAPALTKSISLSVLSESISRELANRFQSQIIQLPELTKDDYENILTSVAADLPENLREPFLGLGLSRVADAVEQKTGFRFAEEILLEAIMIDHADATPKKLVWKRHPKDSATLRIQYSDPLDTPEAL